MLMNQNLNFARSNFDPRSLPDSKSYFTQKDRENLAKASNGNCTLLGLLLPQPQTAHRSPLPMARHKEQGRLAHSFNSPLSRHLCFGLPPGRPTIPCDSRWPPYRRSRIIFSYSEYYYMTELCFVLERFDQVSQPSGVPAFTRSTQVRT